MQQRINNLNVYRARYNNNNFIYTLDSGVKLRSVVFTGSNMMMEARSFRGGAIMTSIAYSAAFLNGFNNGQHCKGSFPLKFPLLKIIMPLTD